MSGANDPNVDRLLIHIDQRVTVIRIEAFIQHEFWLQDVPTTAIVPKFRRIQLHRFVRRLIVQRNHLRANVPEWNRIEIRRIKPLSLRVHATDLILVVFDRRRIELLNETFVGFRFREARHLMEHPVFVFERHTAEINDQIGHLFGHPRISLLFATLRLQQTGNLGSLFDGLIPFRCSVIAFEADFEVVLHRWRRYLQFNLNFRIVGIEYKIDHCTVNIERI